MHADKENLLRSLRNRSVSSRVDMQHLVRGTTPHNPHKVEMETSFGARIADWVAATMGSWKFIIIQSSILVVWIFINITAYISQWDPYPFILLNLALSFQAAYAAPFIMMSQNRQAALDRLEAKSDYATNIKAELEIELLHGKMDALREKEIAELIGIIKSLESRLAKGT